MEPQPLPVNCSYGDEWPEGILSNPNDDIANGFNYFFVNIGPEPSFTSRNLQSLFHD